MCSLWWWTSVSAIHRHWGPELSFRLTVKSLFTLSHSICVQYGHENLQRTILETEASNTANILSSLQYLSWFPPPLVACLLSDTCSKIIIEWEKAQFHIKTALSSQPWGCHWEASAWLQPLFKTHSVILQIIVHCRSLFTAGPMESFGEKNALSWCCEIDFRAKTNPIYFAC